MTDQEAKAIKWMKNIRDDAVVTLDHIEKNEPNVSPMLYAGRKEKSEVILNAFEELERYRALGTVEEIKKKLRKELPYMSIAQAKFKSELDAYRAIGTVDELREARGKQVPKKPIIYPNTNRADCPVCNATVRGISKPFGNFCSKCGHAIDWGDTE